MGLHVARMKNGDLDKILVLELEEYFVVLGIIGKDDIKSDLEVILCEIMDWV